MFIGAIPKACVEQALKIVDVTSAQDVFVCCSGSFRLEQALTEKAPRVNVHSNDVSLLSVALGRFLTGSPLPFRFKGLLEPLEEVARDPLARLAAIGLALTLAKYKGKSDHAKAHFTHHLAHADEYITRLKERLARYADKVRVSDFFAGDFRDHATRAVESGGLIFAWPPTYKGGYERLYKFLHDNVEWEPPPYRLFDPKDLGAWLDELDGLDAQYCVCADHPLEGRKAAALYESGRQKPVFLYASQGKHSSLRKPGTRATPFKYEAVDPAALRAESKVEIARVDAGAMNFIKDRYLKLGLQHSDGMMRFLVYLDGKLAGGFIYSRDSRGSVDWIYLLSDFSLSSERRISKLVAMLSTGIDQVRQWDRARVTRTKSVMTTAFTDKPVSMKYRGIFELMGRKPGFLNYASEVRRESNQAIYADWWKRHGSKP